MSENVHPFSVSTTLTCEGVNHIAVRSGPSESAAATIAGAKANPSTICTPGGELGVGEGPQTLAEAKASTGESSWLIRLRRTRMMLLSVEVLTPSKSERLPPAKKLKIPVASTRARPKELGDATLSVL